MYHTERAVCRETQVFCDLQAIREKLECLKPSGFMTMDSLRAMIVVQVVLALVLPPLAMCVAVFRSWQAKRLFLVTDDQRADTISVLGNPIV